MVVRMKKEANVLIFSAIINVIVCFLKILGGILFHSYTLIVDGYYTISDLITDIIAFVGAKVSRKRANKKYPFGYGRVEYISQMFIGITLFCVGIFLIYKSLTHEFQTPNLNIIYIIIFAIFLKILSANYLMTVGRSIRSQILILSAKESILDLLSSTVVILVIVIGQFFPQIDLVGCILMSILIIANGIKIIIDNILALIGEDDNNEEVKKYIQEQLKEYKDIIYSDSALLRTGSYYFATIEIAVDEEMRVDKLMRLESKIKKELQRSKYKIKFIEFDIIANK